LELKISVQTKGKIFKPEAAQIMHQALVNVMYEAVAFLEREVKERTPHRTGHLARTIHGEVIEKGMPLVKGVVGHQAKYGDFVERGTGVYGPSGRTFVIRLKEKKVTQKGFPGRFMFKRALTEAWPRLRKMFDDAGFRIAKHLSE
jgi:hypothetical protein